MKKIFLVFVLIKAVSFSANAASFDCEKIRTLVEHAVCSAEEISILDDEMHNAYKNALTSSNSAGEVQAEQKIWLRERNKCMDIICLIKAYHSRIWRLNPASQRGAQWIMGVYEFDGNRLDLIQTKRNEVRYKLFAVSQTGNTGEIEGVGQLYDGILKSYDIKNDCRLTFHLKAKEIIVSQVGYCGFGINVIADGEYRLSALQTPITRKPR